MAARQGLCPSSPRQISLTAPDSDGLLIRYAVLVFKKPAKRLRMEILVKPPPKIRPLVTANDGGANRVMGLPSPNRASSQSRIRKLS